MIRFVPYMSEHLAELQPTDLGIYTPEQAAALEVRNYSWTGISDGKIVGCAGFLPQWNGRATAWAFFGPVSKRDWSAILGKIKLEMACLFVEGYHRIEATVPASSGPACRLVHKLGFKVEGTLRRYGPDKQDHFMFARVA